MVQDRNNIGTQAYFLRDICKQWYLTGLKFEIDNPQN